MPLEGSPIIAAGVDEWRNSQFTKGLVEALKADIELIHIALEEEELPNSPMPHARMRGIVAEARSILMYIEMSTTEGENGRE
ncbi:MAG: hypothetical protein RR619_04270 [Raoultibacter sp.]